MEYKDELHQAVDFLLAVQAGAHGGVNVSDKAGRMRARLYEAHQQEQFLSVVDQETRSADLYEAPEEQIEPIGGAEGEDEEPVAAGDRLDISGGGSSSAIFGNAFVEYSGDPEEVDPIQVESVVASRRELGQEPRALLFDDKAGSQESSWGGGLTLKAGDGE